MKLFIFQEKIFNFYIAKCGKVVYNNICMLPFGFYNPNKSEDTFGMINHGKNFILRRV